MSQLNEVVQKLMEEVRKLSCNKQPARGPSTSPEETLPSNRLNDSPNTSAETDQLPSTTPTPNNTTTRCPEDTPHPHSLYDQVHIYRSEVPTFAKTLKDVALNRQPNTSHRTSRAMGTPPRPTSRGPPCIQTAPSPQRTPHSKKTPSPQTTSPRAVHPHSHTLEPPAQAHAPSAYPTSHLLPGCEQGKHPIPRP
ncbi:unnamed protein product [Boreogadus saida]